MNNKILIVGSFSKGALEHQYVRVLKIEKWDVYEFDIQKRVNSRREISFFTKAYFKFNQSYFYKDSNLELIRLVKTLNPKVVLVFKGMEIFPDTLNIVKQSGAFLVNYNPDHPFQFFSEGAGNANVLNSVSIYDLYISYSTKIVNDINIKFGNAACIPFGYDETIKVNHHPIDEVVFIGAYDKTRESELSQLSSSKLSIYGPINWSQKIKNNNKLLPKYKGKPLYDLEYYEALSNSIASINILRMQNIVEGSHNMRTFETTGVGGLMISNRTTEHLSFFEEGKEALYFDTIEELNEIINDKLNNTANIAEMKKAALDRCKTSNYSYSDRVKEFISLIK